MIDRLPTRAEWEREGATATAAPPEGVALASEVPKALASISAWYVPLDGMASTQNSAVLERLKQSVRDHVLDAIETADHEALPIEVDVSVEDDKTAYLAASVALPDEKTIEQRFAAAIQRSWGQAKLQPVGAINVVSPEGAVTLSIGANDLAMTNTHASDNKSFLITAYVLAVLIPIVGLVMGLYTAVAERRAAIRRHAIGIVGISLVSIAVYVVAITSINSANQDRNVSSDLQSLLQSNNIQYDSIGDCAHQNGNQYVCMVTQNGNQIPVQVTDDGKTIYEQGISANGQ